MNQNTSHSNTISDAELAGMQHHADPLAIRGKKKQGYT